MPPHQVVGPVGDHALAGVAVRPLKLKAAFLSLLLAARSVPRRVGIARLPVPAHALCRALVARAKHLRALRTAEASRQDDLVRRVDLLRPAKATRAPRLLLVLPLLRGVVIAHGVWLLHAQPAIGLTRAPVLHPVLRARLCRLLQACLPDRAPRPPLDLFRDRAADCLLHAPQHESAAERSLDFQF